LIEKLISSRQVHHLSVLYFFVHLAQSMSSMKSRIACIWIHHAQRRSKVYIQPDIKH
jgi:hypothetical protein